MEPRDKKTFLLWMNEVFTSQVFINATNEIVRKAVAPITQRLHVAEAELKQIDREIKTLTDTVKQQPQQITELKQKSYIQEKVSRRNNIKIDGLAEKENEDTGTLIKDFLKENLRLDLQAGDILSSERLGIKKVDVTFKPRRILVKFSSYWKKREVCERKKLLKELKDMKVYINEDLKQETAAIYYQARKLVKERKLWAALHPGWAGFCKGNKRTEKGQKIERVEQLAYFTETTSTRNTNSDPDNRQRLELSKSSQDSIISSIYILIMMYKLTKIIKRTSHLVHHSLIKILVCYVFNNIFSKHQKYKTCLLYENIFEECLLNLQCQGHYHLACAENKTYYEPLDVSYTMIH